MRAALTIALPRDGAGQQILAGVDVPIDEQIAHIKREFGPLREHAEFREVQLWISDAGISKRVKLKAPADSEDAGSKAPAKPVKKK